MRSLIILALALTVTGCSLFGSKDGTEPMELVDFDPSVEIDRVWQRDTGAGQGQGFTRLTPAFTDDRIYVVDYSGLLTALDRSNGKVVWRKDLDEPVAGGVGIGSGTLLLGTDEGEVLVLDIADGSEIWRTQLSGEVTSVPAGNSDVVAAQTLDGRLSVMNAESGEILWFYDNPPPRLTLRGRPTPVITDSAIYSGFTNGRVMAFNPQNGLILWEQRVGMPKGRSDLEKMVDIQASPLLQDGILYLNGFQSRLMAISRANGRPLWAVDSSSHQDVWVDAGVLYVTTDQSAVVAYNASSGTEIWRNEQMLRRQLIGPVSLGDTVAVADEEGYLHFMSKEDGQFVNRVRIDGSGARASMWSDGERLYALANDGTLATYRIEP